jgi:hypothetical protein
LTVLWGRSWEILESHLERLQVGIADGANEVAVVPVLTACGIAREVRASRDDGFLGVVSVIQVSDQAKVGSFRRFVCQFPQVKPTTG